MPDQAKSETPIWRVDERAVLRGGEVGGAYLDAIGKTDLATMTADEWKIFCTKVVGGAFLAAIGDVHGEEIPF